MRHTQELARSEQRRSASQFVAIPLRLFIQRRFQHANKNLRQRRAARTSSALAVKKNVKTASSFNAPIHPNLALLEARRHSRSRLQCDRIYADLH